MGEIYLKNILKIDWKIMQENSPVSLFYKNCEWPCLALSTIVNWAKISTQEFGGRS